MSVAFVGGAEQQSIVEVILCIMLDGLERIVLIAPAKYKWKELLSGLCRHACICALSRDICRCCRILTQHKETVLFKYVKGM